MFELEKKSMLDAALEMKRNRLVALCGGNISMRLPDGSFLVTPSGMIYEEMSPSDIVHIDGSRGSTGGLPAVPAATRRRCFISLHVCPGLARRSIRINPGQRPQGL